MSNLLTKSQQAELMRYSENFFRVALTNLSIKSSHGMLYHYILLKKYKNKNSVEIEIPTFETMRYCSMKSNKNYQRILNDLESFKLIKIMTKAHNHHTTCFVSLVNIRDSKKLEN